MQRLADGGPSAKTGVEVGDIIVSVGNKPVKGQMDLPKILGDRRTRHRNLVGGSEAWKRFADIAGDGEGPVSLAADVARKLGPFGLFVTRGEDCTAVRHRRRPASSR